MSGIIESVAKATKILRCFCQNGELGITDLSNRLGYPKSVVHRLVSTLEKEGFLEQNTSTRKYRVGLAFFELGSSYLRCHPGLDLITIALEEVSHQSGHTCYFGIRDGTAIVITHACEGTSPVRVKAVIGERLPVHATAIGKILLADLSDQQIDEIYRGTGLESVTGATLTDLSALKSEARQAAVVGYATSIEELYQGTASVATAVHGETGKVVGAICASFPMLMDVQDEIRRMRFLLKERGDRLSALPMIESPLRDRRRWGNMTC